MVIAAREVLLIFHILYHVRDSYRPDSLEMKAYCDET